jgi:RNA polymerase sigma-70 factor (ECF subfamily)
VKNCLASAIKTDNNRKKSVKVRQFFVATGIEVVENRVTRGRALCPETFSTQAWEASAMNVSDGFSTSLTLLRQITNPRNEEAWRIFVERYQPLIFYWCHRQGRNHNEAEEITADVLAKLVKGIRTFIYDPTRKFRGWLRIVVNNALSEYWRRRARHPDHGSGDPRVQQLLNQIKAPENTENLVDELAKENGSEAVQGTESLVDELDEALEPCRWLQQVVRRVKERTEDQTWQAFWLTEVEEVSAPQVAQRLGMTVAAVYAARYRIRGWLREEGRVQSGCTTPDERETSSPC